MNMFMMHVGKVYWHVYSLFYGHDKILWVNFWVWKIFGHGKNFMGMNFDYRKILLGMWCWFMENFYGYLRHVGTFCAWLWKNLVVVHGCVEDFDCGEILVGHWFLKIFWSCGLWLWNFLTCEFGHGQFF